MKRKILVTGGLGFIGSHLISLAGDDNYEIVCIDNLSNSKISVLDRLNSIRDLKIFFYQLDLTDRDKLALVFKEHPEIVSIIHFAGLKSVDESIINPIKYYHNNFLSTVNLISLFQESFAESFIFSSSATVYGDSKLQPVSENFQLFPKNPYASTKVFCEKLLEDCIYSKSNKKVISLRYFNPIGAHPELITGEDPINIATNLMPHILNAANKESVLKIFGNDYNTKDGTAERDYIHVIDVASAHLFFVENIERLSGSFNIFNVGTGKATSVIELINIFENINNVKVPYKFHDRRVGDIETSYAENNKIKNFGWKPKFLISDMCRHAWLWKRKLAVL